MKVISSLLLSAALHGAALFLIGVSDEKTYRKNEDRFEVDLVTTEKSIATNISESPSVDSPGKINFKENGEDKNNLNKVGGKNTRDRKSSKESFLGLSQLQRKDKLFPPFWSSIDPPPGNAFQNGKSAISNAQQQFNAMGLKEATELLPFFNELSARINLHLEYPRDFLLQGIKGNVNLSIEVDKNGIWRGSVQSISSSNDYLKTYVLALLSQVLASPMKQTLPGGLNQLFVQMSFSFNRHSSRNPRLDPKIRFLKNSILFSRNEYVDPKINRVIEEVFTRYVPPIIPIPGGFYIDFYRAYQYIKNWNAPKESDLRKTRIENYHQLLKSTIRTDADVAN